MAEDKKVRKSEAAAEPKDKAGRIAESKLPAHQKAALLKAIGAEKKEEAVEGRIPFYVYAKMKSIPVGLHKAMLAFPASKGVLSATVQEWDNIFKKF